jgi:hypothetical protein
MKGYEVASNGKVEVSIEDGGKTKIGSAFALGRKEIADSITLSNRFTKSNFVCAEDTPDYKAIAEMGLARQQMWGALEKREATSEFIRSFDSQLNATIGKLKRLPISCSAALTPTNAKA